MSRVYAVSAEPLGVVDRRTEDPLPNVVVEPGLPVLPHLRIDPEAAICNRSDLMA